MRRLPKDAWIWLGLVVLVVVFAALGSGRQSGGRSESNFIPRRTTYSTAPDGLAGLYRTLDKLGYRVTRRLLPLDSLSEDGALFLVAQESPMSEREWDTLRRWVERGNLLIVASGFGMPSITGDETPSVGSSACKFSFLAPYVRSFRVAERDNLDDNRWRFGNDYPMSPFASAKKTTASGKPKTTKDRPIVELFRNSGGPTVGYCKWGKGEIIVMASSWSLSNEGIATGDNIALVLNALDHAGRGKKQSVIFDEYHHGYNEQGGILSLLGAPAKLGLGQLAVAFLLLILAVSRRFGRPVFLTEGARHRSEYLSSMSSLLRRAHAEELIRRELGGKFRRDAAAALGLPQNAAPEAIVEAAARQRPEHVEAVRELVNATGARTELGEAGIMTLAKRWHKMRKELTRTR